MTPYGAATPLCPSGFAYASLGGLAAVPEVSPGRLAARLCGTGPSATLGLLDVTHGYALTSLRSVVSQARLEAPPCTWPRGARAEGTETTECSQVKPARPLFATPF